MKQGFKRQVLFGMALSLCLAAAQAQMYKWVDDKGVTHFSDQAPPPHAKTAPIKPAASGAAQVPLPFELAEAARNHPVVLYTSKSCGSPCDQARSHLRSRGIPFAEKTIGNANDIAKLKEAGGTGQLPFLTVGRAKVVGFEAESWNAMLKVAAYPASRMLPPNYQYPEPVAAAPVAAPVDTVDPRVAAAEEEQRRKRNAPPPPKEPAFQF